MRVFTTTAAALAAAMEELAPEFDSPVNVLYPGDASYNADQGKLFCTIYGRAEGDEGQHVTVERVECNDPHLPVLWTYTIERQEAEIAEMESTAMKFPDPIGKPFTIRGTQYYIVAMGCPVGKEVDILLVRYPESGPTEWSTTRYTRNGEYISATHVISPSMDEAVTLFADRMRMG